MSLLIALMLAQAGAAKVEPSSDCGISGVQSELNQCAEQDFLVADQRLNAQWLVTAAHMRQRDVENRRYASDDDRPGYFDQLLGAQRAWLAFRDGHCASEGYWARGGSMEPMLVSGCKAALTNARTEQLRQLANWPD